MATKRNKSKTLTPAVAYYRTSSATNVGDEKDSLQRQQRVVESYATSAGYQIQHSVYDAALTGDSAVCSRQGMQELLAYCDANGVKAILLENAGRFARDKDHAIRGLYALQDAGIESIIFCDKGMDFIKTWYTNELEAIIPFLEISFAQKEKRELVAKLRGARERKRVERGKCEGRKSHTELNPALVATAKRLHRADRFTGKRPSLRQIAEVLAAKGFVNRNGQPFHPQSLKQILAQKTITRLPV